LKGAKADQKKKAVLEDWFLGSVQVDVFFSSLVISKEASVQMVPRVIFNIERERKKRKKLAGNSCGNTQRAAFIA